jgi:glutamate:GABA antiporter
LSHEAAPAEADVSPFSTGTTHLKRVLGKRDLVLLFVVAVFNLNVLPSIAANGGVTIWLWII